LVGAPIGGALVSNYGYLALSVFTGATLLVAGVIMIAARLKFDRKILVVF
jgi:predicted MFS family arabinose efflux permease